MQLGVSERPYDVNIFLRCSSVERDDYNKNNTKPDSLELRYGSSVQAKSRGVQVRAAAPSTGRQLAQRADDASVLLLEIVTSYNKWTPPGQPKLFLTPPFQRNLHNNLACVSSGENAGTCQLGGGGCNNCSKCDNLKIS